MDGQFARCIAFSRCVGTGCLNDRMTQSPLAAPNRRRRSALELARGRASCMTRQIRSLAHALSAGHERTAGFSFVSQRSERRQLGRISARQLPPAAASRPLGRLRAGSFWLEICGSRHSNQKRCEQDFKAQARDSRSPLRSGLASPVPVRCPHGLRRSKSGLRSDRNSRFRGRSSQPSHRLRVRN